MAVSLLTSSLDVDESAGCVGSGASDAALLVRSLSRLSEVTLDVTFRLKFFGRCDLGEAIPSLRVNVEVSGSADGVKSCRGGGWDWAASLTGVGRSAVTSTGGCNPGWTAPSLDVEGFAPGSVEGSTLSVGDVGCFFLESSSGNTALLSGGGTEDGTAVVAVEEDTADSAEEDALCDIEASWLRSLGGGGGGGGRDDSVEAFG